MEECNASDMPEQVPRLRGRQIRQRNTTTDMEMALEQRRVNASSHEGRRTHRGRVCGREEAKQIPFLA